MDLFSTAISTAYPSLAFFLAREKLIQCPVVDDDGRQQGAFVLGLVIKTKRIKLIKLVTYPLVNIDICIICIICTYGRSPSSSASSSVNPI